MKVSFILITILSLSDLSNTANGFVPRTTSIQETWTTTYPSSITSALYSILPKGKEIGLLTFDLDDTLYPIAAVVKDANAAFVKAMERYGYEGFSGFDIVCTGIELRKELAKTDPEEAAGL